MRTSSTAVTTTTRFMVATERSPPRRHRRRHYERRRRQRPPSWRSRRRQSQRRLGNDRLEGGAGQNDMAGGLGNDTYIVTSATDTVTDAGVQGSLDRVYTSVNFALAAAAQIEFFATNNIAGTAAINLTGNGFANTIYGNNGANVISGKGGNDMLAGRGGPDIFVFDTAPNTTPTVTSSRTSMASRTHPAGEVGLHGAHRQCRHDAVRRPVRRRRGRARCQRPHHLQQRHAQLRQQRQSRRRRAGDRLPLRQAGAEQYGYSVGVKRDDRPRTTRWEQERLEAIPPPGTWSGEIIDPSIRGNSSRWAPSPSLQLLQLFLRSATRVRRRFRARRRPSARPARPRCRR